ncbi:hypothetical protein C8N30_2587 [Sulfitobacter guttiformis]|uniref:Uncharacterized protein n=1 Tax=Sulfitobacter guttiformis TaxID=74349 RepID=A0A420DH35_9RHOB|nr:hypothetical protein C8N30_2587 [Sulfitobacter guttiformis]
MIVNQCACVRLTDLKPTSLHPNLLVSAAIGGLETILTDAA